MNDPRRTARELALRTLYQMEVGSTPLEEALLGAHEQLRIAVVQPMDQMRLEAKLDLKALAVQLAKQNPMLNNRIKRTATAAGKVLDALLMRTLDVCDAVCGSPDPRFGDPKAALDEDAAAARDALERLHPKDVLAQESADIIIARALEHLAKITGMFRRKVVQMAEQAMLLNTLVEGVVKHRAEADDMLAKRAEGWTQERRPIVDQSILRLAVFELLYTPQTPTAIVLNEAVELAKKYSTDHSPKYVNGVLDRIAQEVRPGAQETV
jgi:N utilization substance protein B